MVSILQRFVRAAGEYSSTQAFYGQVASVLFLVRLSERASMRANGESAVTLLFHGYLVAMFTWLMVTAFLCTIHEDGELIVFSPVCNKQQRSAYLAV